MIYVGKSDKGKGRGVFAGRKYVEGEIIEECPVIAVPEAEWGKIEKTALFDYCYSWGEDLQESAIALGFGSLYNHSYKPNAVYVNNLPKMVIEIFALREITEGNEITVNYNRDPDDQKPLWFEVID
jgi:uncharacterized protein